MHYQHSPFKVKTDASFKDKDTDYKAMAIGFDVHYYILEQKQIQLDLTT